MELFTGPFADSIPTSIKLVLLTIVLVAILLLVFWLLRLFTPKPVPLPAQARPPRLAVTDAAIIDGRRRLVLVRRDNVEHLVMIGGASDVLIEKNIKGAATPLARAAQMAESETSGQNVDTAQPKLPTADKTPAQPTPQTASKPAVQQPDQKMPAAASSVTADVDQAMTKFRASPAAPKDASVGNDSAPTRSTLPGDITPATLSNLENALGVELAEATPIMMGKTDSPPAAASPQEAPVEESPPAQQPEKTALEKIEKEQQMQKLLNELTGEKS